MVLKRLDLCWQNDGSCAIDVPNRDNSDVFPGGFASCLGTILMSFLVVLPSVLGISLIDVDPRWHFPFKMVGLGPPINQILLFFFAVGALHFVEKDLFINTQHNFI